MYIFINVVRLAKKAIKMSKPQPPFSDGLYGDTPRLTRSSNKRALRGITTAARRQETTAARCSCLQQQNKKASSLDSGFSNDSNADSDKEEER